MQNMFGQYQENEKGFRIMIYMDHAATTPVSKKVFEEMEPYFSKFFGNASSVYSVGCKARAVVENSREKIAGLIGAEKPGEVIFTSGATEANNLAIKGVAFYVSQVLKKKPHIIISSIEHHCVLDTAKYLEKYFGFEVTYLPVNKEGVVDLEFLKNSIKDNTVMVSVMYGNNEMGAVEPIAEIGNIVKEAKEKRKEEDSLPIIFHTDAVQAFQYIDIDVNKLGIDMLSLTAHKFYGPKGIGILYVKDGVRFLPQQQGGSQEQGRRAGTENVPYIVGMSTAMQEAVRNRKKSTEEVKKLRDYMIKRILTEIPNVELIGPKDAENRLPHISNFLFKGVEGESILLNLDIFSICASSGSACTSGSLESSHVTRAMGYSHMESHGAIRFSFGALSSEDDIDKLMQYLPNIVEKLRAMSPIKGDICQSQ